MLKRLNDVQEGVVGAKPKPQFKCANNEAPEWNRGSHKQASVVQQGVWAFPQLLTQTSTASPATHDMLNLHRVTTSRAVDRRPKQRPNTDAIGQPLCGATSLLSDLWAAFIVLFIRRCEQGTGDGKSFFFLSGVPLGLSTRVHIGDRINESTKPFSDVECDRHNGVIVMLRSDGRIRYHPGNRSDLLSRVARLPHGRNGRRMT